MYCHCLSAVEAVDKIRQGMNHAILIQVGELLHIKTIFIAFQCPKCDYPYRKMSSDLFLKQYMIYCTQFILVSIL